MLWCFFGVFGFVWVLFVVCLFSLFGLLFALLLCALALSDRAWWWHWKVFCASFVVRSSTGKQFVPTFEARSGTGKLVRAL